MPLSRTNTISVVTLAAVQQRQCFQVLLTAATMCITSIGSLDHQRVNTLQRKFVRHAGQGPQLRVLPRS